MQTLKLILTFIFLTISVASFGQTNIDMTPTDTTTSVYGNLPTKDFYNIGLSVTPSGPLVYTLNGREIGKYTYQKLLAKFNQGWDNLKTCTPCILKFYDENMKLLRKAIQYTDCPIGYFIVYYPNGKPKIIGHYKENSTGNWTTAFPCSKEDGTWTYFNSYGQKIYAEYWKDGEFLQQIPEQKTTEIWQVDISLYGKKFIDTQRITTNDVRQLVFTAKFKNKSRNGAVLTIKAEVSCVGHSVIDKTFTLDNFKEIDVQKMIDDLNLNPDEQPTLTLKIIDNNQNITYHQLNIKK